MFTHQIQNICQLWRRVKFWIGYALFGSVIAYGIWSAPLEFWRINPLWLLPAVLMVIGQFILQWWQMVVFLHAHGVQGNYFFAALFTARKGVLNTVLPAKSGTLILLHMLTESHRVRWYDYLLFMLFASLISLLISLMGLLWLLLSTAWIMGLGAMCVGMFPIVRRFWFRYWRWLPHLLLIALGLYVSLLLGFWSVLRGMGFGLSLDQAMTFAITLNALAQMAITPGNLGVREFVLGVLAPYLALPASIGILGGGIFITVRLVINAFLLIVLERYTRIKTCKSV